VIAGQVLIYPGLGGDSSKGSYLSQAEAPGLSARDLEFYRDIYLGPPESPHHHSKFANPLQETDYRGLPPAFLVAAHYDPLCDDCADYAQQLQQAGVAVQLREEPLLVHAFLRARHMSDPAGKSFDAIVTAIESLAHNGRLP
jgi:acetyl esterase